MGRTPGFGRLDFPSCFMETHDTNHLPCFHHNFQDVFSKSPGNPKLINPNGKSFGVMHKEMVCVNLAAQIPLILSSLLLFKGGFLSPRDTGGYRLHSDPPVASSAACTEGPLEKGEGHEQGAKKLMPALLWSTHGISFNPHCFVILVTTEATSRLSNLPEILTSEGTGNYKSRIPELPVSGKVI